ncbi:MAG: hypothetical protein KDA48_04520 [Amphiplicatus sp.]|nr:hypothetical protein [Amphiplicatus sp.]
MADVNETPTDIDLSAASIAENASGALVGVLSAADPDAGESFTFTIADDASGLFEIVGNELKLKDGASADFESQDNYDLMLRVTDSAGNIFDKAVTIDVANVNEAPTDITLSSTSVAENDAGGVVGTLGAMDPDFGDVLTFTVSDDRFEVVGDELKLKDGVAFDFETDGPVKVTVTATDAGGLSTEQNFTIAPTDVNEGPALSFVSLPGLQASYYNIGHSLSDLDQIDFDATPDAKGVVDSLDYMQGQEAFWDGAPSDYFAAKYEGRFNVDEGGSYTFSLASDDGSMLFIDGEPVLDNDGLHGTRTRTVTLDLEEGDHTIEVRFFENGGAATLQLSWSGPDTGYVNEVMGDGIFESGASVDALTVDEHDAGAVIAQLAVADPDAGDAHTFAVSDDRFEVTEQDGAFVLKLKDGVSLDHESEGAVDVSVTVTDSGGASDTLTATITVEDTNAAPEIALNGGEGLRASYFNIGHSLSDLDQVDFNATPDATAIVETIDHMNGQEAFWDGAPSDYFAARYEGQIMVDEGGSYTFSLASDDGSMLFIDGEPVLDNDGLHSTNTRNVTVDLDAGAHDIEVRYFENGGDATLQLSWSGPDTGGAMEVIGGDAYRQPGYVDADRLGVTENVAGDTAAVLTIVDPDNDAVTVTVSDDRFEVVEGEGGYVLKLKDGVSLDHEDASEVSVTVTATDEFGESSSEVFNVPVADVDESPVNFGLSPVNGDGVLVLNTDGGNDDVAIASNLEGFPTDALTVEVRFASDQADVGSGAPLFSYAANDGSNNEVLLFLEGASDKLQVYIAGQKINTGIDNDSLLDGEEHQVSLTWDQASNELKVYVDGEPAFETNVDIRDLKSGGTVAFGQEQDSEGGGFDSSQTFEGEIAEVRIFDYARSGEEIADNAGAPVSDPETEPGLLNNWVMNAAEGGVVEDLVGGNDLVLQNGAYVDGDHGFATPGVMENEPGAVAGVLSADDPQGGGAVSEFVIVNDPTGAFEIVGNELKLKDGVSLDHEEMASVEITVEAVGAGGETSQQTFTIEVADVNEAPMDFALDPASTPDVLSLNQDGGDDDYALAANMDGFPTDALTVEVRFASDQTDVGDGSPLFSYAASNGSDNEALLWLEGSSGNLHVFLAGQKINTGVPNASLLDGEEHQVSFTWDQASNELKVYVDGDVAFETSINIRDLKTDGTMALGLEQDAEGGGFDTGQVFEGEIAEVRIFDYARSGEEIADNAGDTLSDPETEPGLVNNWVMNSASGGVIEDLAGGDDLVLHNGASVDASAYSDAPFVAENEAGAVVGVLSATDGGTGAPVSMFTIADDASGLFEVVGNELKLKDGVALDYETQSQYEVTVEAISANGESTQMTVTVNVADEFEANVIEGGDDADVLRGTAGSDVITGGDGNDNIAGRGGADTLLGGAGDDVIYAGSDDVVDGGDGYDRVIAEDNNALNINMTDTNVERVDGKGGDDFVDGSEATDRVVQVGNAGDDTLLGGSGNDVQRGGDGADSIVGGDGNDNMAGGAGADTLLGGAGDDVIYAGSDDVIDGGDGYDRVIAEDDSGLTINMTDTNVERVDGKGGDDFVDGSEATDRVVQVGNAGDDTLLGGSGDDVQRGGDGADSIVGGDGNDNMAGGAGADMLSAGSGDDVIYAGSDDVIDGGDGYDRVIAEDDSGLTINMTDTNVERVDGKGGDDFVDGSGATDRVVQVGNAGDDTLLGGTGDDVQRGGDGADSIVGGDGNDNMSGGAGADTLLGGAGDDVIYAGSDDVIDGGDGYDRVIAEDDSGLTINMTDTNVERVDGKGGDDYVDGSDATDRVVQVGNAGDDTLLGGAGDDVQRGGDGDDVISGGGGNDNINAGDGNDTVIFSGNRSDYTITQTGDNSYRIIDNRDGSPDGDDRVYNVENFEFADQTIGVANILDAPPTDISLSPASSIQSVEASVANADIATSANGGGADTATVNLSGAVEGSEMITLAFDTIDNSFELVVNGESLTGSTVQLQSNVYDPSTQAFLQFEDGTAINQPWVSGTDGAPRIVVHITEEGVEVLATRTPGSGDYEHMTLVNGAFTAPEFLDGENTVTVINPNDSGPDGLSANVTAQYDQLVDGVLEGQDGAVVGTLSATDADGTGAATFAIADDPSGMFEVVGNELKVKDGMSLDYDDQQSHEVTLEVTDESGLTYQESFTVDVQEARPAGEMLFGDDQANELAGGVGDDTMFGGSGDDTFIGGAGDDVAYGGDGSDLFVYETGDGSDVYAGGAGWTDVIDLGDGATPLGELGADWTIELTNGSIAESTEGSVVFDGDASGVITLDDGSTINFTDIEQITY